MANETDPPRPMPKLTVVPTVDETGASLYQGNVIVFPNAGDPKTVLEAALAADLQGVVILGFLKGTICRANEYFATSIGAGDTVTWLLERCKYKLMAGSENDDDEPDIPTNVA